jgi:PadR family transcriptional regulator, regulatory protein AphA
MDQKKKRESGTTAHALLGALSIAPMSGYGIRMLIQQSIGHFWNESYGQIYPALRRLAKEGLVEKRTERQKGRPDKHVYSLTERGRGELRRWLELPAAASVPRNEMLLKLFFGRQSSLKVNQRHVREYRKRHEAAGKLYLAMMKSIPREHAGHPDLPYWLMTLRLGVHESKALVAWCDETLRELEKMERKRREK